MNIRSHIHFRYLLIYSACLILYLGLVITVNYLTDPYNELGNNQIGLYFSTERQVKKAVLKTPHDAILIGSSKVASIDPAEIQGLHFYNASFSAATPEEIFAFLNTYLKDERYAVIGIDYYMFNEREFPFQQMEHWPRFILNPIKYLTSMNVLIDSVSGLCKWMAHAPPKISFLGQKTDYDPVYDASLPGFDYEAQLDILKTHHFYDYQFSERRMEYLKKIKALSRERRVPIQVFINPENEDVLDLMKRVGLWDAYEAWKAKVRVIFPDLIDLSEGEYSGRGYYSKTDPYHYKPSTGAQMMNRIVHRLSKD